MLFAHSAIWSGKAINPWFFGSAQEPVSGVDIHCGKSWRTASFHLFVRLTPGFSGGRSPSAATRC